MNGASENVALPEGVQRAVQTVVVAASGRLRRFLGSLRTSSALFGLAAVLIIVIAALTALILWHFRATALADAEREIRNLNVVLAEQTARSIQHVDFVLRALAERAAAAPADDGGLVARMRELIADTPQIRGMIVTDAAGNVTHASSGARIYVGDRAHFVAQRDGDLTAPFIGVPYVSRRDGKPAISVSRRLAAADGSFAGIIGTALDPDYFKDIYRGIDLGKASAIALFRSDGVYLVGYPGEAVSGIVSAPAPELLANAASGVYRERDPASGAERLVSFHRVGTLPLASVVAVGVEAVLAEWRKEVRAFASGGVAVAALLCVLIFLLAKEVGRREALTGKLQVNEQRFRTFAEVSSDWFWEQGPDLRFTFLSNAVGVSGLAAAAHLGKTRQEVVHRGVTPEQWRQHQAELDARRPFRDFRFQRIDGDGSLRHISISGRPVFDDAGAFRGYAGSARDITNQIRAEQSLREAKAEAEAASRTRGEFLAVISHELRTPLNAIIGFSDVISRELLGPVGTAKYGEYAGDILTAGRHLLGLINNILDMSKIEARKMELHEAAVDLAALAESCIKIVERQAADGKITLAAEIAGDLPDLLGDEMRLKQMLLNLLSNAIKFTPAGGRVTLRFRLAEAGGLELAVADTGIGMTRAEIDVAMQPFRQVESAMARQHEGTGLGLPLVKAFADLHGATLALESASGVGTVVRILMPAARVLREPARRVARAPRAAATRSTG